MATIRAIAQDFFEACETGKGWVACRAYCTPDASFSAQAEPLAELRTLEQYTEWMKGLLGFIPDGRYVVKAFATDDERHSVCAYGVFSGTHARARAALVRPPARASIRTMSMSWISMATRSGT